MRLFLSCVFVFPDYCIFSLSKGGGEAHGKKPHGFRMSLLARIMNVVRIHLHINQSKEHNVSENS